MSPESVAAIAMIMGGWLQVLSVGYQTSPGDGSLLIRHPFVIIRALITIFVVVPGFALIMARALPLKPEVRFAIVCLSVSPVLPSLPLKQIKLGTNADYAIGVLISASLGALIATPVLVRLASALLGVQTEISTKEVAELVALSAGVPLATGIAIRMSVGPGSKAIERYAQHAGSALMIAGLAGALIFTWPIVVNLAGNGTVAVVILTVVVGLWSGHLLWSGPTRNRSALALAAATRHPGVAIAIATSDFPDRQQAVTAAVLLFILVNGIVTAMYIRWITRRTRISSRDGT